MKPILWTLITIIAFTQVPAVLVKWSVFAVLVALLIALCVGGVMKSDGEE